MLKKAALANQSIASELEPVQKWFRYRARGGKPQDATTPETPTKPADAKLASCEPVAAAVNGATSPITG